MSMILKAIRLCLPSTCHACQTSPHTGFHKRELQPQSAEQMSLGQLWPLTAVCIVLPLRHALFFHVCSFRRKDPWRSRRCPTGDISVTVEEPRTEELTAMSELLQAGGLYRWDGGCWYLRAKKDVNYNNSGLFWLAGCFFFQRFNFQVCCRHNVFFFCKTGLYLLRTLCVLLQEAEEQNANCILHGTRDAHFEHER